MISSGPLVIDEKLGESTWAMFRSAGVEAAIGHMRSAGEGKMGCIRVLVKACGMSLGDAKKVVHFSPTWNDRRAVDDAQHEELFAAVDLLNAEYEEQEMAFKKAS